MTTNKTDAAGSASASTDELGGWTQLADGRWMPPPKPEDQPSAVQCWYMRDDHSFCRLPLDVELALAEMRAERDIGNTYGMLCGAPKPLFLDVVHAGCAKDWEKFEGAARPWLERAVRLGTPPNAEVKGAPLAERPL